MPRRATCRRRSTPRAANCRPICPSNPSYRKVNPADAPIFMLALPRTCSTKGQMYDAASTIMAQKLSQINGVGQVIVGGSALPGGAHRAESDRS